MYKQGDGYFWIGGPGEEAFNVPLGLLVHKGQGPDYDYLHLHYRSSGTLLAMGADPVDALRQMKNTATDPYSGGRNFCRPLLGASSGTSCRCRSPIEVQFSMAPGTALAQQARTAGAGSRSCRAATRARPRATSRRASSGARARARAAAAHDRDEQPVGHLDAGARAARREAHLRSRQGVRHPDRGRSTATTPRSAYRELQEGDGLRAHRAQAVPARGDGLAPLRALVGVGRELRHRRGRLPRALREEARGAQAS